MANGNFVTYLRVSTDRQGQSGLGLEAQRAAVQAHLNGGNWKIVEEVVEVESGRKNGRPELARALRLCRIYGATLLVAKLDRLSRSVAFIANLMEANVPFKAADMPEADETHLHMMSVFAQHEAKAISRRTKEALAASKKALGGHRVSAEEFAKVAAKGRKVSAAVRSSSANKRSKDIAETIEDIRKEGATSFRQVAAKLNQRMIPTPRGGKWSAVQVTRVLNRAQNIVSA